MLGAAAGILFGVSDVAIKAISGLVGARRRARAAQPVDARRVAASVAAFYASAKGLQDGDAVPVIAVTGTAANVAGIIGGIIVFGDPLPGTRSARPPVLRLHAGDRRGVADAGAGPRGFAGGSARHRLVRSAVAVRRGPHGSMDAAKRPIRPIGLTPHSGPSDPHNCSVLVRRYRCTKRRHELRGEQWRAPRRQFAPSRARCRSWPSGTSGCTSPAWRPTRTPRSRSSSAARAATSGTSTATATSTGCRRCSA